MTRGNLRDGNLRDVVSFDGFLLVIIPDALEVPIPSRLAVSEYGTPRSRALVKGNYVPLAFNFGSGMSGIFRYIEQKTPSRYHVNYSGLQSNR